METAARYLHAEQAGTHPRPLPTPIFPRGPEDPVTNDAAQFRDNVTPTQHIPNIDLNHHCQVQITWLSRSPDRNISLEVLREYTSISIAKPWASTNIRWLYM